MMVIVQPLVEKVLKELLLYVGHPDGLLLLLSCGPGLGSGQLLNLENCRRMPAPQRLHWQGDEGNALSLAGSGCLLVC